GEVTWLSGQAAPAILEMLLQEGPAVEGPPTMPAALADLLRHCFQQEPAARPAGMAEVAARLVEIYRSDVGEEYPREMPKAAELRADSLNNRALSLLDLGREEEAAAAWAQALAVDPYHTQATYNAGLHRWQAGRITDLDLVRQLEAVARSQPGVWLPPYLLGQVHLQRRDLEAARAALDEAAELAPESPEVQAALRRLGETPSMRCLRSLESHTREVQTLAISPDGRSAVSGAGDNSLRVWDLASGECLRSLGGHTNAVWTVAITPDGGRAVSGSLDRTLRVWDLASGECLRILEQHPAYSDDIPRGLRAVAITPDGRQAISGGYDNALRVWDLGSGDLVRTLEGHTGHVHSLAVTPDGRRAVSGGDDKTLRVWDLASGVCLRTLEGHTLHVAALDLTRDGSMAVSASFDRTLRIWDLDSGACLRTLTGHQGWLSSVAMSPDGHWAVSGSADGTVRLWDLGSGVCLRTLQGHTGVVGAVAFLPDGCRAVSGGEDKMLRVWQVVAPGLDLPWVLSRPADVGEVRAAAAGVGRELEAARLALSSGQTAVAGEALERALRTPGFERDRAVLELWHVAGCRGGRRKGLRLAPRRLRSLEGHTGDVLAVAFTPDGRQAISASSDHALRVWDLASGECLRTLEGHADSVVTVAVTSDGRWAVSGSDDKTLRVWDVATGVCLRTLKGHPGSVNVAIIPNGHLAVSISDADTLRIWDLGNGRCLRTLKAREGFSTLGRGVLLDITSDGRWAISGGYHYAALGVWDLANGRYSRTLRAQTDPSPYTVRVLAVAATPDGRWAVSGSEDNTLRVWDLGSGVCLRILEGHRASVTAIALTPDGRWAISGSYDGTLRLWDLASGACLRQLESHGPVYRFVALTRDGHYLLTGGSGAHAIAQWVLDWDYEFPEPADWDEGARPYLESFLRLHTPAWKGPFQRSRPVWEAGDLQELFAELGLRSYGWLRPEGVRRKLEEMAARRGG
ncbi:MAG: hypothetical protein QME94_11720, partial [Anaerolineae bacterium]|nr:hypothetical protein [Anaerolineae bacterium]